MRGWAAEYLADGRTWVVLVVVVGLALLGARPLARRCGWPTWVTAGVLLSVAAIVSLTLAPAPGAPVLGPDLGAVSACAGTLVDPPGWAAALISLTDRGERVGNVVMFVPLGFFATLASQRPAVVAVIGILAPVVVELSQALIAAGRDCAADDWVNNTTGALLGVTFALLIQRHFSPDRRETPPSRRL